MLKLKHGQNHIQNTQSLISFNFMFNNLLNNYLICMNGNQVVKCSKLIKYVLAKIHYFQLHVQTYEYGELRGELESWKTNKSKIALPNRMRYIVYCSIGQCMA